MIIGGPSAAADGDVLALDVGGTTLPAARVAPDGTVRRAAARRHPAAGAEEVWDVPAPPLHRALRDYAGLAFVRRTEPVTSELGGTAALLGVAAPARNPELV